MSDMMNTAECTVEKILICEDSFVGILSGIYDAYAMHCDAAHTTLQIGQEGNLRLFAEYIDIIPDEEKAEKVSRTLQTKLGEEVVYDLHNALASEDTEKGDAVYHTVALALAQKGSRVMECLQNDSVRKVFELSRNVWNEVHHLYGFLRFEELENGILYSKIGPKNHIVPMLMPHFSDRFPLENFVIYDEKRKLYGIHAAKHQWFLTTADGSEQEMQMGYSEDEEQMQRLFRYFVDRIAIESRRNQDLQRNMLPLRFREYMTEFR